MLKKNPSQPEELKRMIGPLKIDLEQDGSLDNLGQPNIIDYVDHEPFLTSMSDRGLGGGQPGTILPNNEPSSRSPKPTDGYRPGGEFDKMSGHGAVGADKSQPTLPTGAPTSIPQLLKTENMETSDDADPKKHDFLAEGPPGSDTAEWCQVCGSPKEEHITTREAFVEGDHPRDEEGKFTDGSGLEKEPMKLISMDTFRPENKAGDEEKNKKLSDAYDFKIGAEGIDVHELHVELSGYKKDVQDSLSKLFTEDREEGIAELKDKLSEEKFNQVQKQLTHEDEINNNLQKILDESEFVYRGVSDEELKYFEETGKFDNKKDHDWEFVYATLDPNVGENYGFKRGNVIRIKRSELGDNVKPQKYTGLYAFIPDENPLLYGSSDTSLFHRTVAITKGTSTNSIDAIYTMDDDKVKNQEAFDPVNNAWPVGEQNPDHGCDCQIGKGEDQTYENKGPTLYQQATPQFTHLEGSIGIGKLNPDDTDRNIVPRASQAFSSNEESFRFEECSKPWKEAELPREDSFDMPSTVVGKATYYPEEKSMIIELSGRTYPYYNIEYRTWDAFKGATSNGVAYTHMFKGQTQYFSPKNEAAVNQEALTKAVLYREAMMINNPDDFHWIDDEALKEMMMEGKKRKRQIHFTQSC